MRALTVDARSRESAEALFEALAEFRPKLLGNDEEGYRVSVDLGTSDRRVVAVLNAIEQHVNERNAGPARVELQGRRYMLHPS